MGTVIFHVLKKHYFSIKKGERIVVCGPSGSGKVDKIRCVNRLEEHQNGSILLMVFWKWTNNLKNIEANPKECGWFFRSHFNSISHLWFWKPNA